MKKDPHAVSGEQHFVAHAQRQVPGLGRRRWLHAAGGALAMAVAPLGRGAAGVARWLAATSTAGVFANAHAQTAAANSIPEYLDLDVPFVTTPDNVVLAMLELAGVHHGDHLLDLGSGDGRIVITAALRFAVTGIGVEIDPSLVKKSQQNALKAGVADRAKFFEQDLFATDLTKASVITMYLLPDVNIKLRPALLKLAPGTRLVSHDWTMGDWTPDRKVVVDAPEKKLGLLKVATLMSWTVPANLAGAYRGPRFALSLSQRYQMVTGGTLIFHDRAYTVEQATVRGGQVSLTARAADGREVTLAAHVAVQPLENAEVDWQVGSERVRSHRV